MDDLETDFSSFSEEEKQHPAFPAFVSAMRDKLYGGEALDSAWQWFVEGWEARVQHGSIVKTELVHYGSCKCYRAGWLGGHDDPNCEYR